MAKYSWSMLGKIVQAYEFVQTTCFKIRANLGWSFIPKYEVIVYTSYLYENASLKTYF